MYKHIVRDKRHSTFNPHGSGDPGQHYVMDSVADLSDTGSHRFKNLDSCLSKSRQGGGQTLQFTGQKSTAGLGIDDDNYFPIGGQQSLSPKAGARGPFQRRTNALAMETI